MGNKDVDTVGDLMNEYGQKNFQWL